MLTGDVHRCSEVKLEEYPARVSAAPRRKM
jgi:hypothetical protein